jgi:CHAT domain-containing protein
MAQTAATPITFIVPGQRQASRSGAAAEQRPGEVQGRVKDAVRLAARRSGGDAVRVTAVPGEDVVVLRIAGGPALTLHPETARDLMLGQGSAKRSRGSDGKAAAAPDEVEVPMQLRWRGLEQAAPTRGGGFLGDVLLSAFEVVTDLFKDPAADFVAGKVVAKVDGQVDAGVYALKAEALPKLKDSGAKLAAVPAAADPKAPILVLIHGTFVETTSTFGKLWAQHPQRVAELFGFYGGRVYALDHPTVGLSPIANALTLAQALPAGARLHLATHSRGGLVAEVLARVCGQKGVISADEIALFNKDTAYTQHRKDLQALATLVKAKGITVDRVVRVACPARGTLLASKRLDAYLSVLKWTLSLAGVPVAPVLLEFITEVARRRADPAMLPGLEAMIPDTPMLDWLNGAEEAIPGQLRVVAGDLQGDSIGGWVKTLLADAFYWADNDIVVHTRSMYGGAPRAGGASFLLDQGGKATHFNYFANDKTVLAVVSGLTQDHPAGYQTIGPLSWAGQDSGGLRARRAPPDGKPPAERPAVIVLPGILGSHLKAGDKRIWLSLRLIGGLSKLAYKPGDDTVQPDGPVGMVYDDLIEHLQATHEVIPFGFDWRKPIEEEARRLAAVVDRELDLRGGSGQPVRIVAHSMGGVLTRTMQLEKPRTFERLMKRDGARFLMLGTPNGGSWAPMQVLSGDDTFGNALAAFGSPLANRKARQLMAEMPGFLQLQADLLDPNQALDQASTWAGLARRDLQTVQEANWWHRFANDEGSSEAAYEWGLPPQDVLNQAKALRQRLDAQVAPGGALREFADKTLLVVGQARFTPCGFEWGNDGFVYLNATDGDGRVPRPSALLPGVRTWVLDAEHGGLPDVGKAFDAYVQLLTQGSTTLLPTLQAAQAQRGAGAGAAAATPKELVRSRPSRARPSALPALSERGVFAASGMVSAEPGDVQLQPPLRVRVLNGNLSFLRGTLMVGHSRALHLTGTEAVVNRLVGGAMKESLDSGLYPDAVGSHQIFVNAHTNQANPWAAPEPAMVVVVGLGEEGKLKEVNLSLSVRQGVIAWVQRMAERARFGGEVPRQVELAATLMGSGGADMNASNAARAIASGVRDANQRIAAVPGQPWPQVERLTLVELYLERASDAWHGLQVLAASAPAQYAVEPTIATGVGPLRRQMDTGYRGTDYDFIAATSTASDTISFRLDTKRARTEVRAQSTQGKLLRELVKRASTDGNRDPQLGRTLFQLLVPLEVEPFLAGTSRMLLELDDQTAAVPWELLDTRSDEQARGNAAGGGERPWAIRTRLLRKLQQEHYRQQVQDAQADDAVLVIGEPKVDPETYVALPGARAEAEAVRDALTGPGGLEGRVNALVDDNDATSIINALFERRYRIVHVAGHGEPIKRNKDGKVVEFGGVVLSEGTFLGHNEIRAMRTVPELVFVNCCHLAARDADQLLRGGTKSKHAFNRAEFAMGVADSLIAIGVRCVIAAGWAVDDQPAKVFAEVFYREILARRPFIDAVASAREAAWIDSPDSNTWAAYQAYGDPDWVYRRGPHDSMTINRPVAEEFELVASPLGLALSLEELVVRAKWMGADATTHLDKVRHLEARFGNLWGAMGAVAEAFGLAYAEGGDEDTAIAWYERAVLANDASASMKAQEQLANLRARSGWGLVKRLPVDERGQVRGERHRSTLPAARERVMVALRSLRVLVALQSTTERWSLLGSAWKRLALLEQRAGDIKAARAAFEEAATAYGQAEDIALRAEDPRGIHYAGLNRMALQVAVGASQAGSHQLDPLHSEAVRNSLQHAIAASPNFECHAGMIELQLFEALAVGRLADALPGLVAQFENLHTKASGLRGWQSVADQADLVLHAYAGRSAAQEAKRALELLEVISRLAGTGSAAAAR